MMRWEGERMVRRRRPGGRERERSEGGGERGGLRGEGRVERRDR